MCWKKDCVVREGVSGNIRRQLVKYLSCQMSGRLARYNLKLWENVIRANVTDESS